jgi:hypothetical protein
MNVVENPEFIALLESMRYGWATKTTTSKGVIAEQREVKIPNRKTIRACISKAALQLRTKAYGILNQTIAVTIGKHSSGA